ncbi:MAG: phosphonate C-P lyase system protein PhnH [Hyphomicrobiales bacterium]|nr:phosphonate C-P lyase system protein PhnH [Hyphomicrobiales bacterium]
MTVAAMRPGPVFSEPVFDAQAVFRKVMMAMARPGSIEPLPALCAPPEPLSASAAAVALTLCDHETPIWIDHPLTKCSAVADYLRFYTGAPIVAELARAAFALIADPAQMPPLSVFAQGSPEYPDRSATLVLQVGRVSHVAGAVLTGPGIPDQRPLNFLPMPEAFWHEARLNHMQFPRGVDLVFAAPRAFAALPRSTRIEMPEG